MEKTIIESQASFYTEKGILFCEVHNLSQISSWTSRFYRRFLRVLQELTQGVPMPLIVDLKQARGTLSTDTAKVLSERCRRNPLIMGEAYIVESLSVRLLVQSYVRLIHRDSVSVICSNLPAALRFCDSLLADANQKSTGA